jgi:hypothetical protein
VLNFISLMRDTYKQTNTRKIKKSLLLTLNSSKKMFNILLIYEIDFDIKNCLLYIQII